MKKNVLICFMAFVFASCATDTKKYAETIGSGSDAVRVRYQKPHSEINLPKTAVISCDSTCKNSVTQVYQFEHLESDAEASSCKYQFSVPCFPYACDGKNYACGFACESSEDCALRAVCDKETRQCVPALSSTEMTESKSAWKARESKRVQDAAAAASTPAPSSLPASTSAPAVPTASPALPATKVAIPPASAGDTVDPAIGEAIPKPAPYSGKLSPDGKE